MHFTMIIDARIFSGRFYKRLEGNMIMGHDDISVVICCAGMGTRLGIGTTKALVKIAGKSIIQRQLEMLDEYDDIRVAVGYQAEKVIKEVKHIRKDVMFAFNNDYRKTGSG